MPARGTTKCTITATSDLQQIWLYDTSLKLPAEQNFQYLLYHVAFCRYLPQAVQGYPDVPALLHLMAALTGLRFRQSKMAGGERERESIENCET